MSRSTLAATKTEFVGLLWTGTAPTFTVTGVDAASVRVYDHEPRKLTHPVGVTVAFGGGDASVWTLTVRLYATTSHYSDKVAQDQIDLLMPAIEEKAVSNGGYDARGWSPLTWDESLEAFLVSLDVEVGRQDYGA